MIDNPIRMTERALLGLPDYSHTLPTGTTPGKRWRRRVGQGWWQGRFGKPYPEGHEHHGSLPIFWRRIIVRGQPPQWPADVLVPPRAVAGLRIAPEGTQEGQQCLRGLCLATIELARSPAAGGCSCHMGHPPCGSCMSMVPECPRGCWRDEEP